MKRTNQKQQKPEAKAPALIAYHVTEGGTAHWTRIGAAWDHKDERGFTLQLDLVPVGGGRIVLREFDPKMIDEDDKGGA